MAHNEQETSVSRPLRVVHVITDLDVGGAEIMLSRLLNAFRAWPIENQVVSLTSGGAVARRIAAAGTRVVELGMRPDCLNLRELCRAVRVIGSAKPDIVQTWLYHADLVGLLAGKLARVPHIVWNIRCSELNDSDISPGFRMILRLLARCSRWPSAVVCNSRTGQRVHEHIGYRPRRWELIPNGINLSEFHASEDARVGFRRMLGVSDDIVLVGLVARLHPMKDHETFLRAAEIVARKTAARFVMVGRGVPDSKQLRLLIETCGLAGRVYLLPERGDIPQVMAGLDVAVCSSMSEGFPNVLLESMASAVPCVTTDAGDSAEIVADPARIVPIKNPEALADAITRIVGLSRRQRLALGMQGQLRVLANYSLESVADRYVRLYREIVSTGKAYRTTATAAEGPGALGGSRETKPRY
jgi:glycosyltransferase involved in cell wall biosynthesis